MSVRLTEEQQKFLDSLEEEFKDRYTENDKEFKALLEEEHPLPPVVENWREFRQPEERYGNDRNARNRDRDHDCNCNHYSNDRYSHLSRYVHRYRP